ncbi:hypothetical protein [Rhodocyclus purpureus]|uniref:hypothetical protein n=1 Tax=Rhodocyclus purpureus TaxID=1067 RepID=UPI001912C29D|nr:hypothetical protein [Rhodocyclus purpureus]MBK5912766.1 hypothetical protein [Rhodocyclus purpureus]
MLPRYMVVAGRYRNGARQVDYVCPAENFEQALALLDAEASSHDFAYIEIRHAGYLYTFDKDAGLPCADDLREVPFPLADRRRGRCDRRSSIQDRRSPPGRR